MRDPSDLSDASPLDASRPKDGQPEITQASREVTPAPRKVIEASRVPVRRLKRRADFLHAGKGKRWHGKALSLHAAPARADGIGANPTVARVGFTLTKKVGNAVIRNRARRRLREAMRLCADLPVKPGHDYVIVGRIEAVRLPFAALGREAVRAINDVHGARAASRRPGGDKGRARGRDATSQHLKAKDITTSDAKPRDTRP